MQQYVTINNKNISRINSHLLAKKFYLFNIPLKNTQFKWLAEHTIQFPLPYQFLFPNYLIYLQQTFAKVFTDVRTVSMLSIREPDKTVCFNYLANGTDTRPVFPRYLRLRK